MLVLWFIMLNTFYTECRKKSITLNVIMINVVAPSEYPLRCRCCKTFLYMADKFEFLRLLSFSCLSILCEQGKELTLILSHCKVLHSGRPYPYSQMLNLLENAREKNLCYKIDNTDIKSQFLLK